MDHLSCELVDVLPWDRLVDQKLLKIAQIDPLFELVVLSQVAYKVPQGLQKVVYVFLELSRVLHF